MLSSSFQKAARFEDLVVYCRWPPSLSILALPRATTAARVKQLMDAWVELHLPSRPVSLATFADLTSWPYPMRPPYPPPLLFLPIYRGMHCTFRDPVTSVQCTAIKRRQQRIAEHCSVEHQWVNPVARGNRPTDVNVRERPWEVNIPCQHLRPTGIGGELIHVRVEEQQP
ncbi:unnamed protein product [Periconia digitata]|uniref:Uncharacterized protein n=1 Tax=Periconia digitata TaxID=1303443 RepID=A0A9W4UFN3_9PLEO|nr:unnamed protein product [Periconia digitata]